MVQGDLILRAAQQLEQVGY